MILLMPLAHEAPAVPVPYGTMTLLVVTGVVRAVQRDGAVRNVHAHDLKVRGRGDLRRKRAIRVDVDQRALELRPDAGSPGRLAEMTTCRLDETVEADSTVPRSVLP